MLVEDIYRIISPTQNVDIYRISSLKTKDYVFIGECRNIPLSCLDIPVSQIFTNDNMLVIMIKQFDVEQ